MMRQMRENTKWIMLITALAFVALMVFEWGMDATGRSGARMGGGELGRVDGTPVSYEEYRTVYDNLYTQQQQSSNGAITSAMNRQIEDAAWNQVVTQKLIAAELRRRGITVSDDEIRQAALYSPPPELLRNPVFLTDGQFDLNKYREFLASPMVDNQLLTQLEAYYRDVIPQTKLYSQVVAGTHVSDGDLWRMFRDRTETATIRYLALDPDVLVPDAAVTVEENEVRAYYDERRDQLDRPAQATVRFFAFSRAPTAEDTAAVRERADSLRNALSDGADFGELARTFSADSVSAANGGSLTIRRGQTVPEFDEAAFNRPLNQVGAPVQTQFGYHVLRVDSRGGDSAVVRHILLPIERSRASEDRLLTRADSIDVLTESQTLDEIAQRFGFQIDSGSFNEDFPFLATLGDADEGAEWAFEERPDSGTVSNVLENANAFYVMELLSRREAGLIPYSEAREAMRERVTIRKKLERTRQIARDIADQLAGGASMQDVAAAREGVEYYEHGPFTRGESVPAMGQLNAAVGTAFGLRPGQRSGPVEANESVFIIESLDRTEADREVFEAQLDQQRAAMSEALSQQRWAAFVEALRENATIVDNRAEVLRGPADDAAPAVPFY